MISPAESFPVSADKERESEGSQFGKTESDRIRTKLRLEPVSGKVLWTGWI